MKATPGDDKLWPWVRWFLEQHLPRHRGASGNTVASYRTAFRQLLQFLRQRPALAGECEMRLHDLEPALLLDFLGWLQSARGRKVGTATRNCRLAALRSFFRFLELHRGPAECWERMRALPLKRGPRPSVDHLELPEVEFVFAEVDPYRTDGFRDLTLLALLYNTGARASEIALARRASLTLGELPSIRLLGKGRRERVCPLWGAVARLLHRYLDEHRRQPRPGHEAFLFINQRGARMTRFGVAGVVEKYLRRAERDAPSLRAKKLSVHSFRHTTAIHLLEHGADINVIKAWLGHASTESTSRYLDLTLEKHRALLERFLPPAAVSDHSTEPAPSNDGDEPGAWLERL